MWSVARQCIRGRTNLRKEHARTRERKCVRRGASVWRRTVDQNAEALGGELRGDILPYHGRHRKPVYEDELRTHGGHLLSPRGTGGNVSDEHAP